MSDPLASASLKDLIKVCRSHGLSLPPSLPTDKSFYLDLLARHSAEVRTERQGEREGEASPPQEMDDEYVHLSRASAAALAALAAGEGKEALEGVEGEVQYSEESEEELVRSPAVQKITAVLQNIGIFDYLERHTGIARFYWFVMLTLIVCAAIFAWIGVIAVCNFICFIYPAYMTYKTLEGNYLPAAQFDGIEEDRSIEVHRYWLTYWVVFGLFRLVEWFMDFFFWHLTSYHPLKLVFLVWCFHPSSQGCAVVYRAVIRPLFLPRERQIDSAIERFTSSLSQASAEIKALILKRVAKHISGDANKNEQKKQ